MELLGVGVAASGSVTFNPHRNELCTSSPPPSLSDVAGSRWLLGGGSGGGGGGGVSEASELALRAQVCEEGCCCFYC